MTLDELQKICDAATPGPWTHHRQQHCPQINYHEIELRTRHGGALYRSTSYGLMEVDGEFISAARTEMPKLIDRARKLEAALQLAKDKLKTVYFEQTLCPSGYLNHDLKQIDAILEGKK